MIPVVAHLDVHVHFLGDFLLALDQVQDQLLLLELVVGELLICDDYDKTDQPYHEDPKGWTIGARSIDLGHPENVEREPDNKQPDSPDVPQVILF